MNSLLSEEIHAEIVPPGVALISDYLRVHQVVAGYRLGRSWLYERLANGEIKSFCLKKKGARHGIRLISKKSLDAYLERKAVEASQDAAPKAGTETAPAQSETNSEAEFVEFENPEGSGE